MKTHDTRPSLLRSPSRVAIGLLVAACGNGAANDATFSTGGAATSAGGTSQVGGAAGSGNLTGTGGGVPTGAAGGATGMGGASNAAAGGEHVSRGSAFTPPYPYTLESAEEAQASVMARAGVE